MTQDSFDTRIGGRTLQVHLVSQGEARRMIVAGLVFLVLMTLAGMATGRVALDLARDRLTDSMGVLLATQRTALGDWLETRRQAAWSVAENPAAEGLADRARRAGFEGWVLLDAQGGVLLEGGALPEGVRAPSWSPPTPEASPTTPLLRLLPTADPTHPSLLAICPLGGGSELRLTGDAGAVARLISPVAHGTPAESFVYDREGRVLTWSRQDAPMAVAARVADQHLGTDGPDLDPHPGVRGGGVLSDWVWMPTAEIGLLVEVEEDEAYPMLTMRRRSTAVVVGSAAITTLGALAYVLVMNRLQRQVASALSRLGQYQLDRRIGQGAMGTVYRAQHAMLRRPTAIKLIRQQEASEEDLQRFEREVQLTSRLTHPNTVAIYDYGRTPDGVFYYAMEYLPGLTLQELVERTGPLPEGRVIHLLRQVLGSLAEAHDAGLIHRDIKASNLMVCERGGVQDVVKVLDFGLVKEASASEAGLTRAGAILGTPHYMSPEAVTDPDEVGAASDLYAVAAVGYFLLTGTTLFPDGPAMKVCMQHVSRPPDPPSRRLGRPVSPDLEEALLMGLEKLAEDRPASARAFSAALAACAEAGAWDEQRAEAWWKDNDHLFDAPLPTALPASPGDGAEVESTSGRG